MDTAPAASDHPHDFLRAVWFVNGPATGTFVLDVREPWHDLVDGRGFVYRYRLRETPGCGTGWQAELDESVPIRIMPRTQEEAARQCGTKE